MKFYNKLYLHIVFIIQGIFLPFSCYVNIIEPNINQFTKGFINYQEIYSAIGLLSSSILLINFYKKKEGQDIIIDFNAITTKKNIIEDTIYLIYIYNIIDIIASIVYIYFINEKFLYPLQIYNNNNILEELLLYKICISYLNCIYNIVNHIIILKCN